jgi:serine/threonine-protein kinase
VAVLNDMEAFLAMIFVLRVRREGSTLVADIRRAEADHALQVLMFTSDDPDHSISQMEVARINEYLEQAATLTFSPPGGDDLRKGLADHYQIQRELGRGGMATVYLARDLRHHRLVALKVLNPELAATLGAERFLREIRLVARLQHPHILPVFDSGAIHGDGDARFVWFTMPHIAGESLRQRLTREPQLPLDDAVRIASQVADGLNYAHAHGIVHRDVKPENILLSGTHSVIADFGLARALDSSWSTRITEPGITLGTVAYMSPEQAAADPHLDARSDIYSLGVVVFEMLAGEPPFTGRSAQAILARRLNESVPPLRTLRDVPEQVQRVVNTALARSPADRFPSASSFAGALETAAGARTRAQGLKPQLLQLWRQGLGDILSLHPTT